MPDLEFCTLSEIILELDKRSISGVLHIVMIDKQDREVETGDTHYWGGAICALGCAERARRHMHDWIDAKNKETPQDD